MQGTSQWWWCVIYSPNVQGLFATSVTEGTAEDAVEVWRRAVLAPGHNQTLSLRNTARWSSSSNNSKKEALVTTKDVEWITTSDDWKMLRLVRDIIVTLLAISTCDPLSLHSRIVGSSNVA